MRETPDSRHVASTPFSPPPHTHRPLCYPPLEIGTSSADGMATASLPKPTGYRLDEARPIRNRPSIASARATSFQWKLLLDKLQVTTCHKLNNQGPARTPYEPEHVTV